MWNCRCGTGTCGCAWMKYAKDANVSYQTFLELIISAHLASIWIHTFKMSTLKSTLSTQNAMSSLGILTSKKFYFNYFYELLFSLFQIYFKMGSTKNIFRSHPWQFFKLSVARLYKFRIFGPIKAGFHSNSDGEKDKAYMAL